MKRSIALAALLAVAVAGCTAEPGAAPQDPSSASPSASGPVLDAASCGDWRAAVAPVNSERIDYAADEQRDTSTNRLVSCRIAPPEEPGVVPEGAEFSLITIAVGHHDGPQGPAVALPVEASDWPSMLTGEYASPLRGEYRCWGHGPDCETGDLGPDEEQLFRFAYLGCHKDTCLEVEFRFLTDHDASWRDEAGRWAERNLAEIFGYAVRAFYPGDA